MRIPIDKINADLNELAKGNEEYAYFCKKTVNTEKNVRGVRTPDLRKLAKKYVKQSTAADLAEFMDALDKTSFEQVMLAGMMVNYATITDDEAIQLAKQYVQLVDSWAEIDTFAKKRKAFDEKLWWNFAAQSLNSKNEFIVRYGVIEMMANFLNDTYVEEVFARLRSIEHDGYYVRMGMAWLYATAAVRYYDRTLHELKTANFNPWTKKKALTKMLESSQFTAKQKTDIRALRASIPS